MNRLEYNLRILKLLQLYYVMFPTERLFQGLVNLRVVQTEYHASKMLWADLHYEEPRETLERLEQAFRARDIDIASVNTSELDSFTNTMLADYEKDRDSSEGDIQDPSIHESEDTGGTDEEPRGPSDS